METGASGWEWGDGSMGRMGIGGCRLEHGWHYAFVHPLSNKFWTLWVSLFVFKWVHLSFYFYVWLIFGGTIIFLVVHVQTKFTFCWTSWPPFCWFSYSQETFLIDSCKNWFWKEFMQTFGSLSIRELWQQSISSSLSCGSTPEKVISGKKQYFNIIFFHFDILTLLFPIDLDDSLFDQST